MFVVSAWEIRVQSSDIILFGENVYKNLRSLTILELFPKNLVWRKSKGSTNVIYLPLTSRVYVRHARI